MGSDPSRPARHRRQENQGLAVVDRCLEAVERADVLAAEVHVHERRELAVCVELARERRVARHQIVDDRADGVSTRLELAKAADLAPEGRGNADSRH